MKVLPRCASYCILSIFISMNCQQGKNEEVYQSDRHHFSLSYPSVLTLKDYTNMGRFVLMDDENFLFEFEVYDIVEWLPLSRENMDTVRIDCNKPFCLVAVERAVTCCAADGPDGSFYGHSPEIKEDYFSEKGLNIIKFYMKGTRESYSENKIEKETKDMGPFYGIEISKDFTLLARYAPWELASDDHEALLKNIVNSISITEYE